MFSISSHARIFCEPLWCLFAWLYTFERGDADEDGERDSNEEKTKKGGLGLGLGWGWERKSDTALVKGLLLVSDRIEEEEIEKQKEKGSTNRLGKKNDEF